MQKLKIEDLVAQLQSEQLHKRDFVVPVRFLSMVGGKIVITNLDNNEGLNSLLTATGIAVVSDNLLVSLDPLKNFHDQVADKLDIPRRYYTRIEGTELLDQNVNYWLRQQDQNYFIRAFVNEQDRTGYARALLSDRFKTIDNFDVLLATLAAVKESGVNLVMQDADITDTKMYVRFVAPDIERQAPSLMKNYRVPDGGGSDNGIAAGFIISNSEVGKGGFSITPRLYIKACNNGMIMAKESYRKTHLGARMEEFTTIEWSEETKEKNMELIIAQVKDAVKTFTSPEFLGKAVSLFEEAAGIQLTKPQETIELVSKEMVFSEKEKDSILNYFIRGGDNTMFGINQAMTYYAQKDADPDRQYELEVLATEVASNPTRFIK